LKRGVEWESLGLAGPAEMVLAMSKLWHLGAQAHAQALAMERRVDWESIDLAERVELLNQLCPNTI